MKRIYKVYGLVIVVLLLIGVMQPLGRSQAAVGFHISGRNLLDANGNNFVIRGISHPHAWFLTQTSSIANIKTKSANAVRVVLSGGRWTVNGPSDVANVINLCKTNKLICVLENHDTTGFGDQAGAYTLTQAVAYWQSIQSVLTGQEAYVIINIGNEPYGNSNPTAWINDTKNAIIAMRAAGFQHTLMVDAPNWGQDWQFIMRDNAASVFASDVDRNTIFSIHMYGVFDTPAKVQDYITAFINAGLPLVVGEFGHRHTDGDPDEDTIMAFAQANGIGYMGWSWSGNSNRVRYLDMVTDFNPALLSEWGTRIITGANGLQQTSLESSVYGGPTATPCTSCPTPTKTNTPIGPTSTPGPTPTPGGANLALNKTTTVSSFFSSSTTGAQAVDGNLSTLWRSKKNSGLSEEWISVDLGSTQTFNQAVLKWGGNFPKSYSIRISADNLNWGAIYSTSSGDGGTDVVSFSPATARYVQMHSTAWLSNLEHVWLYEFEVY